MKPYMEKWVAAMLAVCLMPVALAGATAASGSAGIVIDEALSIHQEANASSSVVAEAPNGAGLAVLSEQGAWYRVSYDGTEGYALKSFVVTQPEYAIANRDTLVYAMPQSGAKTVGEVETGTELLVIGEWEEYWAVNLRTASGFVRKDDVSYTGTVQQPTARPQPTAAPTATSVQYMTYILTRDSSLRTQPSANAFATGTMVAGSIVSIGIIQNGFGQEADTGYWLSMNDLQRPVPGVPPVVETSTPQYRYFVISDGTPVYAEPDTGSSVVDTLAANTIVVVGNTQNGFGLGTYNGNMRGWIQMDQLSLMNRGI